MFNCEIGIEIVDFGWNVEVPIISFRDKKRKRYVEQPAVLSQVRLHMHEAGLAAYGGKSCCIITSITKELTVSTRSTGIVIFFNDCCWIPAHMAYRFHFVKGDNPKNCHTHICMFKVMQKIV